MGELGACRYSRERQVKGSLYKSMRQSSEFFGVVNGRLSREEYERAAHLLYYLSLCHTLSIRVVSDHRGVGSTVMQGVEIGNEGPPVGDGPLQTSLCFLLLRAVQGIGPA